jgi:hypothetical protein
LRGDRVRRVTAGRDDRVRDRSITPRASERHGMRGRRRTGTVVARAGVGVRSAVVRGIAMVDPWARTVAARTVRMRTVRMRTVGIRAVGTRTVGMCNIG